MINNDSSQPLTSKEKAVRMNNAFGSHEALDREIASFIHESAEELGPTSVNELHLSSGLGSVKVFQGELPPLVQQNGWTNRDFLAAQRKIKDLKLANKGLREQQPENRHLSDDQKVDQNRRLSDLLRKFEKIEKIYPKVLTLEQQITEISMQLQRNKDAHKNKVTLVELEAFKLATRNEFITLIDFKLDQQKKGFYERFTRVDERLKELGLECAEIIPVHTFKDYLRRQKGIETQIDHITNTMLPGHLTSAQNIVSGKVDRLDAERLITKYLNDALSKIDFNGASLGPVQVKPPTPEKKEKKAVEPSSDSDTPVVKKKKERKVREPSSSSVDSIISRQKTPQKLKKRRSSVAFGSSVSPQPKNQRSQAKINSSSNDTNTLLSPKVASPKSPHITVEHFDGSKESQLLLERSDSGSSVNGRPEMDHHFEEHASEVASNHSKLGCRNQRSHISHRSLQSHESHRNKDKHLPKKNRNISQGRQSQAKLLDPKAHYLEPTASSKSKSRLTHHSKAESDHSEKRLTATAAIWDKVLEYRNDALDKYRAIKAQADQLASFKKMIEKNETRVHEAEIKSFDLEQKLHRAQKESARLDHYIPEFQGAHDKLNDRLMIVESEVLTNNAVLADAPTDPAKRQKYLERRLVLSERSILKLNQEVDLYRVEKKKTVEDLVSKVEKLYQFKHDFGQKTEFLYQKITDNSRILIDQIEGLSGQLGSVKLTVNNKMKTLTQETKLYHQELERTQEINREMLIEKQKARAVVSQSVSRNDASGHKQMNQHDSLAYDSVMSSTLNHDAQEENKWIVDPLSSAGGARTSARFWQSVDRKPVAKPYTARIVPPLLVGDLQKYGKPRNQTNDDSQYVMTQDSIHSNTDWVDNPATTIQSTRDKIQNLISQNLSVRSQKSHRTTVNERSMFLKTKHPVQKLELQKFRDHSMHK